MFPFNRKGLSLNVMLITESTSVYMEMPFE